MSRLDIKIAATSVVLLALMQGGASYKTQLGDQSSEYHIGGWLPGTTDYITKTLAPVLDEYLNTEVAPKFNPPLKFHFFPVDYSLESYSTDELGDGILDFLYSLSGRLACLEPEHGWTALATQRAYVAGVETGAQGSIIFTLQSNNEIKNISDFKKKRIGIGFVLSGNAYTLAVQLVFYNVDYASHFRDVMMGNIDVGILPASWIYSNRASYLPLLRVHNPTQQVWEGEPFPVTTSTALVPQYSLSVAPFVPLEVKQAVADALMRLNRTHPAAIKMGITGFTVPTSYGQARSQLQQMNLLAVNFLNGDGGSCVNPFENPLGTFNCPSGYVRQTQEIQSVQCHNQGLSCPVEAVCFCQPCVLDHEIRIFPAKTVLALCITSLTLALALSAGWVLCLESSAAAEAALRAAGRAARDKLRRMERNAIHMAKHN